MRSNRVIVTLQHGTHIEYGSSKGVCHPKQHRGNIGKKSLGKWKRDFRSDDLIWMVADSQTGTQLVDGER
jgi:hypothetical protein